MQNPLLIVTGSVLESWGFSFTVAVTLTYPQKNRANFALEEREPRIQLHCTILFSQGYVLRHYFCVYRFKDLTKYPQTMFNFKDFS